MDRAGHGQCKEWAMPGIGHGQVRAVLVHNMMLLFSGNEDAGQGMGRPGPGIGQLQGQGVAQATYREYS